VSADEIALVVVFLVLVVAAGLERALTWAADMWEIS
jgi:hypothetical protein